MNAVREALERKRMELQLPSLDEMIHRIRDLKREFKNIGDDVIDFFVKFITDHYNKKKKEFILTTTFLLTLAITTSPVTISIEIELFKKDMTNTYNQIRNAVEFASKSPDKNKLYIVKNKFGGWEVTENRNQSKLKRDEEPSSSSTATINPLAKK